MKYRNGYINSNACFVFLALFYQLHYIEHTVFCFAGWIYDITQKYDFSFYICGLLYLVGLLFLLIQPCIQIIEQSRKKNMGGTHV